jgi:hypothetical protein
VEVAVAAVSRPVVDAVPAETVVVAVAAAGQELIRTELVRISRLLQWPVL